MNVEKFLKAAGVEFDLIRHRPTYDAQHMAHEVHVSGKEVAKTVLLRADSGYAYLVAVLPADRAVNLQRVSEVLGGSKVELATELEIKCHCPDCECGALPPFGSQYGMKTLVDASFECGQEIVFEGNQHNEAVRIKYADYCGAEHPMVADFTTTPHGAEV